MGVVIFVLSVMRVVGGVPLCVECVFRCIDVVCLNPHKTTCTLFTSDPAEYSTLLASDTNINKLQITQNTALRIATGCTRLMVVVISMCLLYVSLGSRVSPSIFGLMFMGSVILSICSSRCVG